MSVSRRKFVSTAGAAVALTAIGSRAEALGTAPEIFVRSGQPQSTNYKELVMAGVSAAKDAGAQYADVRIGRYRTQGIQTRERRVQGLSDNETAGIGIRTLVDGAWGFAATAELTTDAVANLARTAVAQARANRAALARAITLAPAGPPQTGTWRSPIKTDPFTIPIADKVQVLLAANAAALAVRGVRFASANVNFLREEKWFGNTDGSYTEQVLYRCSPNMTVTAVSADNSDFQTRNSTEVSPRGLGYEYFQQRHRGVTVLSCRSGLRPRTRPGALPLIGQEPVGSAAWDRRPQGCGRRAYRDVFTACHGKVPVARAAPVARRLPGPIQHETGH